MVGEATTHERGFSLIELLVALVITLIVSGAIYGLLAGGQNAFRREPELTERQQNIRMAMDMIMRDIANAGSGLPPLTQVFRTGLDACVGCPDGGAPLAPLSGVRTDELEIISSGGRDSEPVCAQPGNSSGEIVLVRAGVDIPVGTVIILTSWDGSWTTRTVTGVGQNNTGTGACSVGAHTTLQINQGAGDPTGLNVPGGPCVPAGLPGYGNTTNPPGPNECTITGMHFSEMIRYRIRNGTDGVPVLQRSTTARWEDGFQTVARGIEDLQVEYAQVQSPTVWVDNAPVVANPPVQNLRPPALPPPLPPWVYGTLTRHVRVTLAARSEGRDLQGAQTATVGEAKLRGSLTTTGSPRSALIHVVRGKPGSPAPASPDPWYWE